MRTAILIHGRHLGTTDWERIIWGEPQKGIFGNVSKGIRLAMKENAELIYWGTGSSKKDGTIESQYIFEYAVAHAAELPEFKGKDAVAVEAILKPLSFIDLGGQNTAQEVERAARVCLERGIERLILVSAPTHSARCLQEAEKLRARGALGNLEVFATSSDVPYAHSSPDDVVIIEPPHRGDAPMWQTHRYAKAVFEIMKQGGDVFSEYLADWGALLKKYGINVNWPPKV